MILPSLQLIMMGPPGSGKGTQCATFSKQVDVLHISTGDLFRFHEKENTDLGQKIRRFIRQGELVPDELTMQMLKGEIESLSGAMRYILDGFPRTLNQAMSFDQLLDARHAQLDLVICIEVPRKEIENRLLLRIICQDCSLIYRDDNTNEQNDICQSCGGTLNRRIDDRSRGVIRRRLRKYDEFAKPIMDYYSKNGILSRVDGSASISQVMNAIKELVLNSTGSTLLANR